MVYKKRIIQKNDTIVPTTLPLRESIKRLLQKQTLKEKDSMINIIEKATIKYVEEWTTKK